ncbi:hypothetical protein [Azospirillum isscasi]|uniref:Uncharacterized protein n=1 Tax=Azospirillum isscasi TaxID=3053926 RepID=A0ABU0WFD5_9PROT|nr:hypothetical protein [Azospirillum isscasi]MDQ2102915.1 hypothetical protein [Azospirillum isscasi]
MSIAAASAYTSTLNLKATTTLVAADKGAAAKSTGGEPFPSSASGSAVIVSLSVQAQAAMATSSAAKAGPAGAGTDAAASRYTAYFPTRDGKPATALAKTVSDPGAVSSSAGLSGLDVAKDARARMDAQYAAMEASGKPFDINSFEGKDWYSLMGDLDRRSLYAVRSNAGGQFTKEEQDMAQSIMVQQQGLAMGLYSGPISQEGSFVDPFAGNHAARMKAGVKFLDGVGGEEKSSVEWATSRAAAQFSYETLMEREDEAAENLDSDNPLVKLIKASMETMRNDPSRGITRDLIRTPEDLKNQAWFKGFESQLDQAIEQTKAMYRSDDESGDQAGPASTEA